MTGTLAPVLPSIMVVGNFFSGRTGTRGACEDLSDNLEGRGCRVIRASHFPSPVLRVLEIFIKMLTGGFVCGGVIVEVYSGRAFRWAEFTVLLCRFFRKPFVLWLHGGNLPAWSQENRPRVSALFKRAAKIVTPSKYLAEELRGFGGEIVCLPNGIRVADYRGLSEQNNTMRMGWLRAFHEIYAPAMAVETLAVLAKEFPGLELHMAGPDKGLLLKVQQFARKLGVEDKILFSGKLSRYEVPEFLGQCGIYLNTTKFESFGMAVMEAAASGLCIVSSAVGEIPYLWKDGEDALLVPSGDVKAMAFAVRRLILEPDLASRLSRRAREKAVNYDWSRILPLWEQLIFQSFGERS